MRFSWGFLKDNKKSICIVFRNSFLKKSRRILVDGKVIIKESSKKQPFSDKYFFSIGTISLTLKVLKDNDSILLIEEIPFRVLFANEIQSKQINRMVKENSSKDRKKSKKEKER